MRLIKFWADWCAPCKTLDQVMKGMDYTDIDTESEEGQAAAIRYDVRALPTLMLVDEEYDEVSRLVGVQSRQRIESWMEEHGTTAD